MNAREQRGLQIAATSQIISDGKAWIVPSQHSGKRYTVTLTPDLPRCTCPDYESTGVRCKHIFAVEYTLRDKLYNEEIPAAPKIAKPTYKQEWPAYNQAQTNEKAKFQLLLYELCQNVEEPVRPAKPGRPRMPLAEMIFCVCFKIYLTMSGRRSISDLKDAHEKGYISHIPHFNSIFNYLETEEMTAYLRALVEESSTPLSSVETDFAVDASGFSTCRYMRWLHAKYSNPQMIDKQVWVKVHLMCGVKTNIVTSALITPGTAGDSPQFKHLVEATSRNFVMNEVSADKAYSSEKNLKLVQSKAAMPYIPFRSNATAGDKRSSSVWKRLYHFYSYNQEWFLQHYHKRSNVETTFSMIKAKFGGSLRSKTERAQFNEALCKVLCHNICVLIQSIYELGIDVDFSTQAPDIAE